MKPFQPIVLALALALPPFSWADVSEVEEFDFELEAGGRISVKNINGDITVTGGAGDTVKIRAHKKAGRQEYLDGLKVTVEKKGDWLRIETRHPDSLNRWFGFGDSSGSVAYEISAPADVDLDAIETVNGEISISGITGDVIADTTNGEINATGLRSNLEADTTNGGIDVSFDRLGGDQRVVAKTVNGRVQLRLPADASARVDAGTVNGGIDADDFGLEPDKGFVGRDLDGVIGGGDARVTVKTVNGSIRMRKN